MTVTGRGGTGTCQTTVQYVQPISYNPPIIQQQPIYVPSAPIIQATPGYTVAATVPVTTGTSVSLSQIPYTGFDFGATGNAIYWMSLVAFALSAAYLLVYYKGGAMNLIPSFAGKHVLRTRTRTRTVVASAPAPVETTVIEEAPLEAPLTEAPARHAVDAMRIDTSDGMPRIVITRN